MTESPAGARIVTLLDEVSITQLLLDVSQHVSQSQYLFLPHPGSATAFAAAPQIAPAFVEVITDFRIEQTQQYCIVTPVVSWRADAGSGTHPAVEMIVAEFRYAVSQVDSSAYEMPLGETAGPHTAPTLPSWSDVAPAQPSPLTRYDLPQLPAQVHQAAAAPQQIALPHASPQARAIPPQAMPQSATPSPAMPQQAVPAQEEPLPATHQSDPQPEAWLTISAQNISLPLGHQNILGRKPSAHPARPEAQLVAVPDPARSLSKTHAILEFSGGATWVTDLGSTNGSRIVSANTTVECALNTPTLLAPGDVLILGDVEATVSLSRP